MSLRSRSFDVRVQDFVDGHPLRPIGQGVPHLIFTGPPRSQGQGTVPHGTRPIGLISTLSMTIWVAASSTDQRRRQDTSGMARPTTALAYGHLLLFVLR